MTESQEAAGRELRAWQVFAAAIIPAMVIVPPYLFPMNLGRPVGVFDGRRLMELLWVAGLLMALLIRPQIRTRAAETWSALPVTIRWALGVIVAGSALSAALSTEPSYAFREWGLLTALLVATLPLAAILAPARRRILETLGLVMVFYGIVTIGDPLQHGFAHPRFQGQVLAIAAPILLFSGSWLLSAMAGPAVALGAVNGSRALILTIIVLTASTPFLWSDGRARLRKGLAGLTSSALLFMVLVWSGHGVAVGAALERGTSSTGRLELWMESLQRFLGAPLIGEGPGLLAQAPGVAGRAAHPHNTVALLAAESGLLGLAVLAVLVYRFGRWLPSAGSERRPWLLGVLGGLFHSLLSGTLIMPASQSLFVLTLALILPSPRRDHVPTGPAGWVIATTGAVALVVVLAFLDLPRPEIDAGSYSPRFFHNGMIPWTAAE